MKFIINNIKGAFFVKEAQDLKKSIRAIKPNSDFTIKHYTNYTVIKNKFVFIAYWNGYVNFTKVANEFDIFQAIEEFENLTKILCQRNYEIHSINAHGKTKINSSITEIKDQARRLSLCPTNINRNFSPALFLKFENGTFMLFQSGNFSILGVKHEKDLHEICKKVEHLIAKCVSTQTP